MIDNIGDVVGDGIESGELIIYGIAHPPQGTIRGLVYSGEKIGRYPGKISDGRIVADEGKVIKNELIVQGVEINRGTQENQQKQAQQRAPGGYARERRAYG
jgi:hypothetical protein